MEEAPNLASLSPEERQAIILERVKASGKVIASELAHEFRVSEDSIRRDLRELADAGFVQRFHGGASRPVVPPSEFHARENLETGEKRLIGRAAAAVISDGATLLIDSGTTVIHFIKSLSADLTVRIITTAADVATAALDLPKTEVVLLGGRMNRFTRSVTGSGAMEAVRAVKADYCILGTCGIDGNLLLRADDYEDAHLKAAMIAASDKTLLLASPDKLGRVATYEVASVSVVSTLFTTRHESSFISRIRAIGVDIEMV